MKTLRDYQANEATKRISNESTINQVFNKEVRQCELVKKRRRNEEKVSLIVKFEPILHRGQKEDENSLAGGSADPFYRLRNFK